MRSAWSSQFILRKAPASTGASSSSVSRDFRGGRHLGHQVVVPFAFDLEVSGGAELDRLDQVMGDVGVDAGLEERVERGPSGSAADKPGFQTCFGTIRELAGFPDVVAMATDQMRSAIAIG